MSDLLQSKEANVGDQDPELLVDLLLDAATTAEDWSGAILLSQTLLKGGFQSNDRVFGLLLKAAESSERNST